MAEMITTSGRVYLARYLLAQRPVELVPLVHKPIDDQFSALDLLYGRHLRAGLASAAECLKRGAGLRRRLAEFVMTPTGEAVGGQWPTTPDDDLPLVVAGIGIVLSRGGPVAYTARISDGGARLLRAGDVMSWASPWPIQLALPE